MMAMVTMMSSLATALAAKFAVGATRNVVFTVSAFVSLVQHIFVAEFTTS